MALISPALPSSFNGPLRLRAPGMPELVAPALLGERGAWDPRPWLTRTVEGILYGHDRTGRCASTKGEGKCAWSKDSQHACARPFRPRSLARRKSFIIIF